MALVGRAARKVVSSSLKKAWPDWDVVVPGNKHSEIADIVVKTGKHNVIF